MTKKTLQSLKHVMEFSEEGQVDASDRRRKVELLEMCQGKIHGIGRVSGLTSSKESCNCSSSSKFVG